MKILEKIFNFIKEDDEKEIETLKENKNIYWFRRLDNYCCFVEEDKNSYRFLYGP